MNVNIEILVKGVGRLEISSKDVDTFGVPLIFNLSDIKDVSSRKANFSKTIKVIGSKQNNSIFNHLYEIKGQNFTLKMGDKHNCVLLVNKNPVMDGYFVLKQISKLLIGNTYQVVYEINIFDQLKSFFSDLGDKSLIDLDFSSGFTFNDIDFDKGDHTFNIQDIGEQMRSETDYTNVYDYPIIDYGYDLIGNSKYPYNITTSNGLLYPAVYQKAIVDKIFSESSGYSYNSNYLEGISYSGFFKNMMNIYNKGIDFTNIDLCEYTTQGAFSIYNIQDRVSFGRYVAVFPTYIENFYNIDDYLGSVEGIATGPKIPIDGNYKLKLKLNVIDDKGGTGYIPEAISSYYRITKYNYEEGTLEYIITYESSDMRIELGLPVDATKWYIEEEITIEGVKDDFYFLTIYPGTIGVSGSQGTPVLVNGSAALELTYIRELDPVFSGTTTPYIYINQFLPDMKQSDFIKEHIKLANLYIWSNKEDPKRLYIEPREDFYKQGSIVNWTEKVDYEKEIVIKSSNDQIAKTFRFKYTEGSDVDSGEYVDLYGEVFGTKVVDVDNNYLTNKQTVELKHQSWVMNNKDNYLIPSLYDDTLHTWFDDKSSYEPMWGFKNSIQQSLRVGGYYRFNMNGVIDHVPYVTHAKVMGGDSFDLNYETNNEIFTITNYDSSRGAYKIFWENYINNITDKDSRIVEMYCYLELTDILNLDFRNRVLIDGQMYYLEKVEYDPSKTESSKVTLLKEIDPIEEGSFETFYLLKNDSGDYITTSDGTDGLGDGGNKIIIN